MLRSLLRRETGLSRVKSCFLPQATNVDGKWEVSVGTAAALVATTNHRCPSDLTIHIFGDGLRIGDILATIPLLPMIAINQARIGPRAPSAFQMTYPIGGSRQMAESSGQSAMIK